MNRLVPLPGDLLVEEARRREREKETTAKPRTKKRKCLGCGKAFNAREMRSHRCKVGWTKRQKYKLINRGTSWVYVLDQE